MATVRTITFCEIMTLNYSDLDVVFHAYPSLKTEMQAYAAAKKAKYEKTNQEASVAGPRRRESLLASLRPMRRLSSTFIPGAIGRGLGWASSPTFIRVR